MLKDSKNVGRFIIIKCVVHSMVREKKKEKKHERNRKIS